MENLHGHRVFIASPGGLKDERKLVRDLLNDFNAEDGLREGTASFAIGWEQTPPGVGRAQALINEQVREADYMILLFKDRWGSAPDDGGAYTSGTEEEFHIALEELGTPGRPMRNILVLFATLAATAMADPGAQLQRVLDFRSSLEASRQLMFGSFDDLASLQRELNRAVKNWSRRAGQPKEAVKVRLTPSGDSTAPVSTSSPIIARAEDLSKAGQNVQAELLLSQASAGGDFFARAAYAKHMRRIGNAQTAFETNKLLIAELAAEPSLNQGLQSLLIDSLANNALIEKKRGRPEPATNLAREAVLAAKNSPIAVDEAKAYALDIYGNVLEAQERWELARQQFQEALESRQGGAFSQVAQSRINVARLELRLGNDSEAIHQLTTALSSLDDEDDALLIASALAARSEALEASGDLSGAEADAARAFQLNEAASNSDGKSISAGRLASIYLRQGRTSDATHWMSIVADESSRSGNLLGMVQHMRLQATLALIESRHTDAESYLLEALDIARKLHQQSLAMELQAELRQLEAKTS